MSKRFTENIDQLDEFYQSSFEQGGLEPPADMWDRIEQNLDANNKKGASSWFSKRNSLLLLLLFTTIAALVIASILYQTKDTKIPTPAPSESPAKTADTAQSTNVSVPIDSHARNKARTKKSNTGTAVAADQPYQKVIADSVTNVNATVLSPDSIAPKQEPKKRVRFRDKYKKMPTDTLPLFVPIE